MFIQNLAKKLREDLSQLFARLGPDRSHLFEMANFDPEDHRFGVSVKLNILQSGARHSGHGPRLKVFRVGGKPSDEGSFFVRLNPDESKVVVDPVVKQPFLRGRELGTLLAQIKKYRMVFMAMWLDDGMSVREARALMDRIDRGESWEKISKTMGAS